MKPLKRVVIKEELVELTGDFRPALILNQFIYWIERMKDADRYILEEKERASKEHLEVSIDESNGWIYKTAEELNEELMVGMSKATIGKYINQLVEAGYLNKRNNPKYKWDKTLQYRVDLYKIQKDLAMLGYALEGYKLLPNIEIVDIDESKKAPSIAVDGTSQSNNFQNDLSNNSIPQSDEKYTENEEKNKESNASKILDIIEKSCVAIKKIDLGKCEEEFTDTDRLKVALEICERNNSNGIKALRLAYKNAYDSNNGNSNGKGAGHGVNNTFKKHSPSELEKLLKEGQKGKFKDLDNAVKEFVPNFPI